MLTPISSKQWDFKSAAHLLNRAGFGGTPADIGRLVALGPQEAVASLLDFEKIPDDTKDPEWAKPDPTRAEQFAKLRNAPEEERRMMQQQRQREDRERIMELRGWWFQRMANGPRPLQEKLVLFWHGHFATSMEKVREPYFMWRQNELFRRMATGNWQEMLVEVAKDPAMLLWLDQARAGKIIRMKTLPERSWNCSHWAKAITPRRTSPKPPAL